MLFTFKTYSFNVGKSYFSVVLLLSFFLPFTSKSQISGFTSGGEHVGIQIMALQERILVELMKLPVGVRICTRGTKVGMTLLSKQQDGTLLIGIME